MPDELYQALRERAKTNHRSLAQEAIALLEQNVATASELARRRKLCQRAARLRDRKPLGAGPFPTTEEMVGEGRLR
ncbi:MAG: Arc family DNA-binding protein [Acidobacteriota bacterium]